MRYDLLALIILSVLVFSLLLLAALISIQLMRTPDMDAHERISASRMTYFLLVAAMIYVRMDESQPGTKLTATRYLSFLSKSSPCERTS